MPAQPQQQQEVNRLSRETSPYLLQHQHNPVDWYAWGPEAFEAARAQDKPIFLSVGYSTCYWCHVMKRESFENEEIAALMNEHFICIKVDREERPDVDDIYMTAVQIFTGGHGGWPMSVFLEPQSLKPFLGGTYLPPRDSFGRPGFPTVLRQVAMYWKDQRQAVLDQANNVAKAIVETHTLATEPASIGPREIEKAISELLASHDHQDGGFVSPGRRAPKFPQPVNLDFLMGAAWDLQPAKDAVLRTLDRMAIGGMHDQIGGGFHRYSVDEQWLVPHFEKMLYDNAQLASTYARAYELTNDPYYAQIVRRTLDYVLREMTDASTGGFYSAQDAEVNEREGGNYVWTAAEVREALADAGLRDDTDFALEIYGFTKGTNFTDPHHPEDGPKNVVHLIDKPAALARRMNLSLDKFNERRSRIDDVLLTARRKRPQPGTDDKILAGWNGLMIAGLADGGRVLSDRKYTDAAARAAQFVLDTMRTPDGGLLRSYRAGQAKINAFLEDYAMMIRGLIALHRATNDRLPLEAAKELAAAVKVRFWDSSSGAYFDTLADQTDLFVRVKSAHDGATPSGNALMLHNLLDLHELTGHAAYLDDATAAIKALSSTIRQRPGSAILSTLALKRFVDRYPRRIDLAPEAAASGAGPTAENPVRIAVSPNEINVSPGSPATATITIRIANRLHINANQPGEDYLIPLRVELTGAEGLRLVAQYPPGEAFTGEIAEGTIYVHSGAVSFPITIEQTGRFSGRPQVVITYQACTDRECYEPKREILPLRIIAAR